MPAYSRILTPPGDGSAFILSQDTGARFPQAPFLAVVWDPDPAQPYVLGETVEYPLVIQVVGDALLCVRSDTPADWAEGWKIADLGGIPSYERGGTVTLAGHFAEHVPPYTVTVRSPSGSVTEYGSATGVTDDSLGVAVYPFEPQESGWWGYRWHGADGDLDDAHLYVDRSDVL